jgi:ribonuclease HI
MTLWCIWKRRNDKLWNEVETLPRISLNMACDVLFQWQRVRINHGRREQGEYHNSGMADHRQEGWIKPVFGEVKCNVDAAIFKEQGCYGVGMCLREDRGEFIRAKTSWYKGLPQPKEAEARGLKEAIKWLGTLRFPSVSIELDCKQVVDGISSNLSTNSMFGAILNTCKVSLMNRQNFKISFIRRQANNVAHLLARASLSYASS